MQRDHDVRLDGITHCTVRINERNLCPEVSRALRTDEPGRSFVFLAFNPSLSEELEYVSLTLPYSTMTVMMFNEDTLSFKTLVSNNDIDTFCNENPN